MYSLKYEVEKGRGSNGDPDHGTILSVRFNFREETTPLDRKGVYARTSCIGIVNPDYFPVLNHVRELDCTKNKLSRVVYKGKNGQLILVSKERIPFLLPAVDVKMRLDGKIPLEDLIDAEALDRFILTGVAPVAV